MRRNLLLLYTIVIAVVFIYINIENKQVLYNDLSEYYINNFIKDTGAFNSVASIYLNYRVYDTIFEALMLLISVIAIIHFSRHEGGSSNEQQ